jgi:hypothetical protein
MTHHTQQLHVWTWIRPSHAHSSRGACISIACRCISMAAVGALPSCVVAIVSMVSQSSQCSAVFPLLLLLLCRRAQASGAQQQLASSPLTSPFPGGTPTHLQMQQHSSLAGSHSHLFAGSSTAPTSVASSEAGDWENLHSDHTLQHHHGGGGSGCSGLGSSGLGALNHNHHHAQGLDAGQGFAGSSSSEAGAGPSSPQQHPRLPPINTSGIPFGLPSPVPAVHVASSSLGGAFNGAAAAAAAAAGSSSSMRLGLKLEQRSDVRRLVDVLSRRVRQASEDLGAAVAEVSGFGGMRRSWFCCCMPVQRCAAAGGCAV